MDKRALAAGVATALLALGSLAHSASARKLPDKRTRVVGQQRLEYAVRGAGGPVVVFESGMGVEMDSWAEVFPGVARFATAFAYNRPSYGRSKPRLGPNSGEKVVSELHRLLEETGQRPPYVLVGHSYGGLFVNLFARTYPAEVAGVVFVESGHPDQLDRWRRNRPGHEAPASALVAVGDRPSPALVEWYDAGKVVDDLRRAPPFPEVPVVVVTAGNRWLPDARAWREQWLVHQRGLAALSPRGRRLVASESGHFVQRDQPDVVVRAIREVVESARGSVRLAAGGPDGGALP